MTEPHPLAAGDFSSWLAEIQGALRGERGSDVPCNGCTACCTAAQFVHIGPEEVDTLAHIPPELLFPAPGQPAGRVLMGYDERGHCPMLIDERCAVYEHRPLACRTYDCRIFAATGVAADGDEGDGVKDDTKAGINRRAGRWTFGYPGEIDRTEHEAVRAAARYVRDHRDVLPPGAVPSNPTQLAVLAIEVHSTFLRDDETEGRTVIVDPDPDDVLVAVTRRLPGDERETPRWSKQT